ncbi:hypothetical protein OPQ81_008983 [Rhizoctonia solani]|nr:hypothetical protein OPQ81_008983 [Rhizoctonia solani]
MSAQHEDGWVAHLADLTSTILPHPVYSRDPTYYFRDGNVLLLVEDSLFKVHASVLGRESGTFNNMLDLNDRPTNNGHESRTLSSLFIHVLWPPEQSKLSLFINFHIYLDVAEIANRFSAPNLRSWAHGELRKIASSAYEELSRFSMRTDYQLRALLYAKRARDEELAAHVRNAIQLHFAWVSTNSPVKLVTSSGGLDAARERLVRVFKHPKLQDIDPALFGFAFCGILGFGHEVWMKDSFLSQQDRVMLLSGQVRLMPLPLSTLGLDWMDTLNCQNQKGIGTPIECCSECDHFLSWEACFGDNYRQQLRATTPPLCGISQLAILPVQRLIYICAAGGELLSECELRSLVLYRITETWGNTNHIMWCSPQCVEVKISTMDIRKVREGDGICTPLYLMLPMHDHAPLTRQGAIARIERNARPYLIFRLAPALHPCAKAQIEPKFKPRLYQPSIP